MKRLSDPLDAWIKAHAEELRPHAGQPAAIDPARGLCILAPTVEALLDELARRGLDTDPTLTLTPIF